MTKTTDLKATARAVAERTADAYSWDNYGEARWYACALMLLKRGYSEQEAEAILRSKWTRWAADAASNRKGWRYGRTTSADLARFLDATPEPLRSAEVAELVSGTFLGSR
jgi:hypothetical protein